MLLNLISDAMVPSRSFAKRPRSHRIISSVSGTKLRLDPSVNTYHADACQNVGGITENVHEICLARRRALGQLTHLVFGLPQTPRIHSFAQAGAYPLLPVVRLSKRFAKTSERPRNDILNSWIFSSCFISTSAKEAVQGEADGRQLVEVCVFPATVRGHQRQEQALSVFPGRSAFFVADPVALILMFYPFDPGEINHEYSSIKR